MKRLILLSVAFASLFFYACDGPKKQSTLTDSTQTVVDTLVYSYQRFTKNDSIVHPTFGTMTISFTYSYPVLADKSKTDLSNYIASLVDKGVSSETVSDDILSQSKEFYKMAKTDYDAAMQALQNDTTQGYLPQAYEQSTSINIQYSDSNTVVIEKAIYSFTGGAHGIYGSTFYNYSQKLHKAFTINDIVAKNNHNLYCYFK